MRLCLPLLAGAHQSPPTASASSLGPFHSDAVLGCVGEVVQMRIGPPVDFIVPRGITRRTATAARIEGSPFATGLTFVAYRALQRKSPARRRLYVRGRPFSSLRILRGPQASIEPPPRPLQLRRPDHDLPWVGCRPWAGLSQGVTLKRSRARRADARSGGQSRWRTQSEKRLRRSRRSFQNASGSKNSLYRIAPQPGDAEF